jgi:hypothetical protein
VPLGGTASVGAPADVQSHVHQHPLASAAAPLSYDIWLRRSHRGTRVWNSDFLQLPHPTLLLREARLIIDAWRCDLRVAE